MDSGNRDGKTHHSLREKESGMATLPFVCGAFVWFVPSHFRKSFSLQRIHERGCFRHPSVGWLRTPVLLRMGGLDPFGQMHAFAFGVHCRIATPFYLLDENDRELIRMLE